MPDISWLLESLHHVALRVGRADELGLQAVHDSHLWPRQGPVELVSRVDDQAKSLMLRSVAPVPPRISLLFSEAVHQLRAALDNVVFNLASETVPGPMTEKQVKAASFPIARDDAALRGWTKRMRRDGLPGLTDGALSDRIACLQSFVDFGRQIESVIPWLGQMLGMPLDRVHALMLLQEYSNQDKHRTLRTAGHPGIATVYGETFGEDDRSPRGLAPATWSSPSPRAVRARRSTPGPMWRSSARSTRQWWSAPGSRCARARPPRGSRSERRSGGWRRWSG
ncbi:hypothetical protein AVL61_12050 [Kocuria rosea subsp. polaris]|uniref:Uncharacterized protein n=1 Tax=Kocuria rosea subsp. polaris TaxID=136273 RepID=A0A0W8I4G8_KOCRO|nr:hypothetical protein [Kocuria polaris]KUG52950.1 hypothetical protein AVL61_12050 [Kocuria polaris]